MGLFKGEHNPMTSSLDGNRIPTTEEYDRYSDASNIFCFAIGIPLLIPFFIQNSFKASINLSRFSLSG